MHPPLHKPHPECGDVVKALELCHLENSYAKFWGACNDAKGEFFLSLLLTLFYITFLWIVLLFLVIVFESISLFFFFEKEAFNILGDGLQH